MQYFVSPAYYSLLEFIFYTFTGTLTGAGGNDDKITSGERGRGSYMEAL